MILVMSLTLGLACTTEEDPNADCVEALEREQHAVGTRAVDEVDIAANTIAGVLQSGRKGRLDRDELRRLRSAQRRLRGLKRDLDQAFNTGCM